MAKRHGKDFAPDIRPEWRAYWSDPSTPHPDHFAAQRAVQRGPRANPTGQGYCHHYRLPNEHYHVSQGELEACED